MTRSMLEVFTEAAIWNRLGPDIGCDDLADAVLAALGDTP